MLAWYWEACEEFAGFRKGWRSRVRSYPERFSDENRAGSGSVPGDPHYRSEVVLVQIRRFECGPP